VGSVLAVTKDKAVLAALLGLGIACLLPLLLDIAVVPLVPLVATLLLSPGSALGAAFVGGEAFGPPLVVIGINAALYAGAIQLIGLSLWTKVTARSLRRAIAWLAFPVGALAVLACIPRMNPLWPRGLGDLTARKARLEQALPLGMPREEARRVLASDGIDVQEERVQTGRIVLNRERHVLAVRSGDTILSARFRTGATQFPCAFDMELALVFGPDGTLLQRYVNPLRLCP